MLKNLILFILMAVMMTGCVGMYCKAPVSKDTIVLLPKADGSTGKILVTEGASQVLLDSPYASAHSGDTGLEVIKENPADLDRKFATALAAMPPASKSYLLYFETGTDDFNEESKASVGLLLDEMRQRPHPEITVIGHTDTVGSDDDNDALSLKRAIYVKGLLIELGISPEQISVAGRGERELLVPTEDGVDEQKNRRVEVNVR